MGDARVVYEVVNAPELVAHFADEMVDQFHLAHIAQCGITRHAARLDCRLGEERLRADFASRHLDVIECDAAAVLRELERHCAAESGSAAGDDGDPASKGLRRSLGLRSLLYCGRRS